MNQSNQLKQAAPSRGRFANTGNGPRLIPIDIGHATYFGLLDPDTAFWSLVEKESLVETLSNEAFLSACKEKADAFSHEMDTLRFGLGLSAVYVNPTERCNLNCTYCYIPKEMRRNGGQMTKETLFSGLGILKNYFESKLPQGRLPQIIFHGAEPFMCREIIFEAIEHFAGSFRFGIQTNGTMLDEAGAAFLMETGTSIGLSLDAPVAEIADRTRKTWKGDGVFGKTMEAVKLLKGYSGFNVICTVTRENMAHLSLLVDLFHAHEVPATMLNMLRCTLAPARDIRPSDQDVYSYFEAAIKRTHELYRKTGRKLIVANFANILISIMAPSARRLMCDISPCGGGRVFFALAPDGSMYPCSEFLGLPKFCGGNLFRDNIDNVLQSPPFLEVTNRRVETIDPCRHCAVRHFCGAPCPAEANEMRGALDRPGAFCEFYEEQVRLALRIIADGSANDFLWDGWDNDTETLFDADWL